MKIYNAVFNTTKYTKYVLEVNLQSAEPTVSYFVLKVFELMHLKAYTKPFKDSVGESLWPKMS